jgi:hypothetical protein
MQGLMNFIKKRWYLRAPLIITINLLLFLFISFPNPVLFIEQLNRQHQGMDNLVVTDNPLLIEFAEDADNYSHNHPDRYIQKTIRERRDYEVYWNVEYWAYPHETIEKGAGDCEDLAILTKAVHKYISEKLVEEEEIEEEVEEVIIKEVAHVYVVKNYTTKNKTVVHGWKMTKKEVDEYSSIMGRIQTYFSFMPGWRWILYLCLATLLNYRYYRWLRPPKKMAIL